MRIGFLELVRRSMRHVLEYLGAAGAGLDIPRQRWPVIRSDQTLELPADREAFRSGIWNQVVQCSLELPLESRAEHQHNWAPLHSLINTRQRRVMQLITQVQSHLKIVITKRIRA